MQTDVSFEDQQKINTFSKLNARKHELEAQIAAKKRAIEDYEEAGNEAMLMDDETVPFVVGECLVHLPREEVEERLQQRTSYTTPDLLKPATAIQALVTDNYITHNNDCGSFLVILTDDCSSFLSSLQYKMMPAKKQIHYKMI